MVLRLQGRGFTVAHSSESGVRHHDFQGFQRHQVFLDFPKGDGLHFPTQTMPLRLVNSHCGTAPLRLFLAVYVLVCSNGLVAPRDHHDLFKMRHIRNRFDPEFIHEKALAHAFRHRTVHYGQDGGHRHTVERVGRSINYGIKTGYNDAFIIDNATKETLIAEDPKSADILKPILRGRDIQRYRAKWANPYLIDTPNGYGGIPAVTIDDYPAIKTHLDRFYPKLKKRQDKDRTPYTLRNCACHEEFAKEKQFWIDLTEQGRFAYNQNEVFCANTAYVISGSSIKYLCAALNSNFTTWFMKNTALNSGMGTTRWVRFTVERLPIPKISTAEQRPFINLVDGILEAKACPVPRHGAADPKANTTEQEAEIDRLVYALYGLTTEEISAVDGL